MRSHLSIFEVPGCHPMFHNNYTSLHTKMGPIISSLLSYHNESYTTILKCSKFSGVSRFISNLPVKAAGGRRAGLIFLTSFE